MGNWSVEEWRRRRFEESLRLRDEAREDVPPLTAVEMPDTVYRLTVTCRRCGGPVMHEANSRGGMESRAVVRCASCRRPWQVRVEMYDESGNLRRVAS